MSFFGFLRGNRPAAEAATVVLASDQTPFDAFTSCFKTLDEVHSMVHAGRMFSGGHYVAALASGGVLNVLIRVGATAIHARWGIACGGDSTLALFENTIVSATGSALATTNHNRNSAKVNTASLSHTPTITNDGTQLNSVTYIPGGAGGNSQGGTFDFNSEFILAANTDYLLRVTNITNGVQPANVIVCFYEPTL